MTNKTLVVDTNIFLTDGNYFKKLKDCDVVIPYIVIEEADNHKGDLGDTGLQARIFIRNLDAITQLGDVREGIELENNVKVFVKESTIDDIPDNIIVDAAVKLKEEGRDVVLVSNDANVRVKASFKDVESEKLNTSDLTEIADIYSGLMTIDVDQSTIDSLYANKYAELDIPGKLYPNQYINLRSTFNTSSTAVARAVDDKVLELVSLPKNVSGIRPRNLEQGIALNALLDPENDLVTIVGKAGTGKTLLSLAAALELVLDRGEFKKLVIVRPLIPMGREIGFMPGGLQEKIEVWMGPIWDNIAELLGDADHADMMIANKQLEMIPPTHIRGRSLKDTILFVDEAQGLTHHEMKTIATRMGKDSKLIVVGDIAQIDNQRNTALDNGLTSLIEVFKEEDIASHITLVKGERSSLSSIAADKM